MKRIILLLAVLLTSSLLHCSLEEALDAVTEFNKLVKHNKGGCWVLEKGLLESKYDLFKNDDAETSDFYNQELAKLRAEGLNERLVQEKLASMVKLHEKQLEDWRKYFESHYAKSLSLYKKCKAEVGAFKNSHKIN